MTEEELQAPLDPNTNAMIADALERAKESPDPIIALSAIFDKENRLLITLLSTGQRLAIPQEDLQYLADASVDAAADVSIEMLGMALHWEKLDLDFSVEGLVQGRRGNASWMTQLNERWQGVPRPVLQVA